ncbi:MAG: 4Fe-4S dicluster domain-containing protein, partial [Desulfobacterales bacterium]|nr:4Fe-4S dicluster domain-containing protein [Desulfobacterales bacterium]
MDSLISPASASFLGIPTVIFALLIPLVGVAAFTYIMALRAAPLVLSAPDPRFNRLGQRLLYMVKYAIGQYRQPRYMKAGVLHILLFAGFIIVSLHSINLVMVGIKDGFVLPGLGGLFGDIYYFFKELGATMILVVVILAAIRRGVVKPARYAVPAKYGKDHTAEAVFVLALIGTLIVSDAFFEGTEAVAAIQKGEAPAHLLVPFTLNWFVSIILSGASMSTLQGLHLAGYFVHDFVFFFFLCFLPLGKHFHVITSLPNVFFMRLNKGTVKPVRHGVADDDLDDLESFGVKKFEDFTWKHMLDFYSCADCGRCSDNCPANAVGRPLSPRFITIKCRDYAFNKYPLRGPFKKDDEPLIGGILDEDEIWSCTTCGACERECPLLIEYIDKIVDLRRGMVD